MTRIRRYAPLAFVFMTFGCSPGRSGDTYPPEWPQLAKKSAVNLSGHGCPDLSGTYALYWRTATSLSAESFPTYVGKDVRWERDAPWASTFLAESVPFDRASPWERIKISGDANQALTVRVERTPQSFQRGTLSLPSGPGGPKTLDYERSPQPAEATVTIPYGTQYRCEGGWLVGTKTAVLVYPKLIESNSRMFSLDRYEGRFSRSVEGDLVLRADVRVPEHAIIFNTAIALGSHGETLWARWPQTRDSAQRYRAPAVPWSRLDQQNKDLEEGKPTASARPPAATRRVSEPFVPTADEPPTALEVAVRSRLASGVDIGPIRREGDRFVVNLLVNDKEKISKTLESLSADRSFVDVQLHGFTKGGDKPGFAMVSFQRRGQ